MRARTARISDASAVHRVIAQRHGFDPSLKDAFNEWDFVEEEKMKKRERKTSCQTWFFFQVLPFWAFVIKKTHSHFGAWPFLFIHV